MRILILYHSGVGSTKLIAELIQKKLADSFSGNQVDIFSVEDKIENLDYDLFIMGFLCSNEKSLFYWYKAFYFALTTS